MTPSPSRAPWRLLAVILLLPAVSGCSLLRELLAGSYAPPTATFEGMTLSDATLEGARAEVRFAIDNPGPLSLRLSDIRYAVEVNGAPITPAPAPPSSLNVAAGDRTTLTVPLQLAFPPGTDTLRLRVAGTAAGQTPTGPVTLPLTHEAEIPAAKPPQLTLGLPSLASLGFTSAGLSLPVKLANPNPYPLRVDALDGTVAVAGFTLGSVSTGALGALGPREERSLTVPLVIDFLKLAGSVASLSSPQLELRSQLRSGAAQVPIDLTQAFELPRAPRLSFGGVRLSDPSLSGVTLELDFKVENPNAMAIKLDEITYGLKVEGASVAVGGPKAGTEIAASGTTDVTFPARIQFAELASSLPALLLKKDARFSFEGSLGADTPGGKDALSLSHAATFALPRLPEVSLGAPRIEGMDFTSAKLSVPVTVTNGNTFAVPVSNLAGALSLSGAKIAQVATGDLGKLEPGKTRTLSIPVTISLVQTASAAMALQGSSVKLGFDGELLTGDVRAPIKWSQSVRFSR